MSRVELAAAYWSIPKVKARRTLESVPVTDMDPEVAKSLVFVATGDEKAADEAQFKALEAEVDRKIAAAKMDREYQT